MSQSVFQRADDPYIYLKVKGEWYCYDPASAPLGNGAMGTVYLGYHVNDSTPVAVKRVKDLYADNRVVRERARQEASLAFRHPNLVEMIGYCEYAPAKGPIFLISKYVEGLNADVYLRHYPVGPERTPVVCAIVERVLDALIYIHSYGVVHRDIKPSNIMVESNSNVRLMDLGIARMNDGNQFSQYGFIGTPGYSSPEQILRDKAGSDQIGGTTDIYALGITFYELLTGSNPFNSGSTVDVLTRQIREPLPPSNIIPKRLMAVIHTATQKEQSKRYKTAYEFKLALRKALQPPSTLMGKLMQKLGLN